jgi:S1-C subfamily serine protease
MSAKISRGIACGLVGIALSLTSLSAAPEPRPQVIHVELEHKQLGSRLAASSLKQATAEPGGLEIAAGSPAEWFQLGFKPGDVIVTENGSPVGERMYIGDGIHVFDVLRNGRPLIIRVVIHPAARRTRALDEDRFDKLVDHVKDATDPRVVPIKNKQGISGVRVVDSLIGLYMDTEVGDIIRTIDSNPIVSDAQLTAAITNLRVGTTEVALDRGGRPVTLTLVRKAPLDLTQIKKLSATRYEVTRVFADAISNDTDILSRKVTITPRIKNNKPQGFTIYDIQPDSPAAKLGFLDGDIVIDVDGREIDTLDEQVDARTELESATKLDVHIERKGKPVTLTYLVAP